MKNTILIITLIIGFLLTISEGESFLPNILGLGLFGISGTCLGIFSTKAENHYED